MAELDGPVAEGLVDRLFQPAQRAMRESITSGETPFRKACIQAVIDRVEVDDGVVRIVGDKSALNRPSGLRSRLTGFADV